MTTGVAAGAAAGAGTSASADTTYDAFISYAHADERVAVAIERGLRRLTRPLPISRRALRVFRDTASLGASSDLEGSLRQAIDRSRFFVLIASPTSAHRPWVTAEVEHWLEHHGTDGLILVLAGGTWSWDRERHRFDPAATDALPTALLDAYEVEPLIVDLRWADARSLSLRHAGFRRAVADVAAPIHGRPRDELESEDQRRRAFGRAAVIALGILLAALAVVALVLAVRANAAERKATKRADEAAAGRLAAEGELADHRPDLAMLLGVASLAVDDTRSNRSSLLRSMAETPLRSIMDEPGSSARRWSRVALSRDGSTFATLDATGRLDIGDVDSKKVRRSLSLTVEPNDGNPKIVATQSGAGANLDAITELAVDRSGGVLLATATGYIASAPPDGELSGVQSACLPLLDLDIAATADQALLGCSTTDDASWFVARFDHGQLGYTPTYEGQIADLTLNRNADAAIAYTVPTSGSGEASHLRVIPHGDQVMAADYNVIDLVRAVAISPDASKVAIGNQTGEGQTLTVSTTGSVTETKRALSPDPVTALAFSADGYGLVSGTSSGAIATWSSSTLDGQRTWTGHEREISQLAVRPDGGIVTADHGRILGWEPAGTALASPVPGLTGAVYVVTALPDDQVLLGAKGGYELLTGPANGPYRVVEEAENRVTAMATAARGGVVVTGDAVGHIVVRDAASLAPRGPAIDGEGDEMVWDVAISPDGRRIAAAYLGGATVVYDATSGSELDRLPSTPHARSVAFSPDGTVLAIGAFDGSVALRDWQHGRELRRATPHRPGSAAASVQALSFVQAGSALASVGSDGSVVLSSVASLEPVLALKAPTNDLRNVWVQGDLLSTIDIQGTIFSWDARSGQPVDSLRSGLRTWDAAILSDGRLIAGLVDDGAATWTLRPDAVRARACSLAARELTTDEWQQYAPGADGPPPCEVSRAEGR